MGVFRDHRSDFAGGGSCTAQKAAEARDVNAQAFWLEVKGAVRELLTEAAPPGTVQH